MSVQGRVVGNYPLAAAFVVRQPKLSVFQRGPIERLLNRERVRLGRDKGTTWWLGPDWKPGELFREERLFEVLRTAYEGGKSTCQRVGECRVLVLPEAAA